MLDSMVVDTLRESPLAAQEPPLAVQEPPLAVVGPPSGWVALDLRELWRFRELLFTLGIRDLKLRYRQTAMGVSWVVLQPLISAGLFSFVFGKLAQLPSDGVPYFIFAFAGTMGWTAFQTTLNKASTCLVGNAHLVSKVYFPRIALPLSITFAALIDFTVSLPMFIIMLVLNRTWHYPLSFGVLLVPVWLFLLMAMAEAIGLFCSALTVQYRDVQYIVPVMVQFLMYATPVAYSVSSISARIQSPVLKTLYFLNPLAGLMSAFRWSLLGTGTVYWGYVAYSVVATFVCLVAGAFAFRRMEQRFADVI